ncbi:MULTISPECIES: hypothetical protein [Streptomyces]|uniref:hypothetical protein n=1 Tax=Streptomyces TaxID=1883 RepID=UPI000765F3AC|nr:MULTISPECIES: hypothetical protein [Streptomyces]MDX3840071.1 hypothetical protein [Streptomyces europaeiscabiei]
MAIVPMKQSDLNGEVGPDEEFAQVVVREHPNTDQPKVLDVQIKEVDSFKTIDDLVMLEITIPGEEKREVAMRLTDFNKLAPDMPTVLKNARGTRGRVPGTRVGNGNG